MAKPPHVGQQSKKADSFRSSRTASRWIQHGQKQSWRCAAPVPRRPHPFASDEARQVHSRPCRVIQEYIRRHSRWRNTGRFLANCTLLLTDRIKVFNLDTFERRAVLEAHRGSILGLCLSQDQTLLFSSATDPIVNVRPITARGVEKIGLIKLGMEYTDIPQAVCPLLDL